MVLHGDELGPAVLLGHKLQHSKLVGPHRARANVPHLAALNQVVECFHDLFRRGVTVVAVNLEQINIVSPETLQRRLDLVENCRTRLPYSAVNSMSQADGRKIESTHQSD